MFSRSHAPPLRLVRCRASTYPVHLSYPSLTPYLGTRYPLAPIPNSASTSVTAPPLLSSEMLKSTGGEVLRRTPSLLLNTTLRPIAPPNSLEHYCAADPRCCTSPCYLGDAYTQARPYPTSQLSSHIPPHPSLTALLPPTTPIVAPPLLTRRCLRLEMRKRLQRLQILRDPVR